MDTKQATAHAHVLSRCMWLNFEHTQQFESFKKKFPQRRKSNSNLPIDSKKTEIVRIYFRQNGTLWPPPTHDGRVGFLREAGSHTPLCVAAISGAMLRGTLHWPVLGRPSKHVPTLVLSFASTITTNY